VVGELEDPRRTEPGFGPSGREMLEAWMEYHRATLELTCEGLDDRRGKARPVSSSLLSLHGLVRHMAEVERGWFRKVLLDQPDAPYQWSDEAVEDSEPVPLDDADWESDLAARHDECQASRNAAADKGLDDTGTSRGERCTLRWIYLHMTEEYARHNGHADLIRELVDGAVGCWSPISRTPRPARRTGCPSRWTARTGGRRPACRCRRRRPWRRRCTSRASSARHR